MSIDFNQGIGAAIKGILFAALGGAFSALTTALYNYHNYSNPVDWHSLENAAGIGALLAAGAWFNGHQALWTPIPGTVAVGVDQHIEDLQKLELLEALKNTQDSGVRKSAEAGKG